MPHSAVDLRAALRQGTQDKFTLPKEHLIMKSAGPKKDLSPQAREALLAALKARFEKNMKRHPDQTWTTVLARLEANAAKLATLHEMENTGGALFGDRRFGRVFFYHNGAQSYYSARGFRASVRV